MSALVRLRAPAGTDECNYDGQRFTVRPDGTCFVVEEAVDALCRVAGFVRVPDDWIPPKPATLEDAREIICALPAGDARDALKAALAPFLSRPVAFPAG